MTRDLRKVRIPGASWWMKQAAQAGSKSETAHNAGLDTTTEPAVNPATPPATNMKNTVEVRVEKLPHPEHCGDWHDKPVRWNVICGSKNQKFSTKKDAETYARLWRRNGGDEFKTFDEWRKTWC